MFIIVENEVEHDDGPPTWAQFWAANVEASLVPDFLNHAATKTWTPELGTARITIAADDKPGHELFTDSEELVGDLAANW